MRNIRYQLARLLMELGAAIYPDLGGCYGKGEACYVRDRWFEWKISEVKP